MKILEMTAVQVRIFAQDTIPYHLLLLPNSIQSLVDRFSFQQHEAPIPIFEPGAPRILNLLAGELEFENKRLFIEQLNFENRKIVIRVKGSTNEAKIAFAAILAALEEICPGYSFESSKVILQTDQTECIAHLEIDFLSFFSQKFKQFYRSFLPQHLPNKPEMIVPRKLGLEINFLQPKEYKGYNISLSSKIFAIEPRANTKKEEKIFFTQSPCPSQTHLDILLEIEKLFRK